MIRFLLNGTDYGSPLNWMDVKIKRQRDEIVRGLFVKYTSEMEFTGDAYVYLKSLYDSQTCKSLPLEIQRRPGLYDAWQTVLEGVITLGDATFDNRLCSVKCSAEQSGCNGTFAKHIDTEVDIGSAGDATAGTLWKEVTGTFKVWYDYTEASADGGPGVAGAVPATPVSGCYGKNALLIFNQISEFITGLGGFTTPCLPVVSDFLSESRVKETWHLDITAVPNDGDYVTIEWDDDLENHHKVAVEKIAGETALDFANKILYAMIWQWNTAPAVSISPRWRKGEVGDATTSVIMGGHRVEYSFYRPITNLTFSCPSGTFTNTQITSFQDGAKDCVFIPSEFDDQEKWTGLSSGGFNYGQLYPGILKMSFKKFFEACSKMWNLGMQIEDDGIGGWQIRIEPVDYFYANPVALTMRDIGKVERYSEQDLFAKKWWFGKEDDSTNTAIYDGNPEITTFPGSASEDSTNTEWWYYADQDCEPQYDFRFQKEIVPALGITLYQDICAGNIQNSGYLYLADVTTWIDGPQTLVMEQYIEEVGFIQTILGLDYVAYGVYCYSNIMEQPEGIYRNMRSLIPEHDIFRNNYLYLFDGASGLAAFPYTTRPKVTATPSVVTIPEGAYWLPYRWKFETRLNWAQWDAIVFAEKVAVNQGTDPTADVEGWIREVEYRVYDGLTNFIIETKE